MAYTRTNPTAYNVASTDANRESDDELAPSTNLDLHRYSIAHSDRYAHAHLRTITGTDPDSYKGVTHEFTIRR